MIRRSNDQKIALITEITKQANDRLTFVLRPTSASEDDLMQLEALLDKLSVVRHELGPVQDLEFEEGTADPPRGDQSEMRERLSKRFHMLGFYHIPETVTKDFSRTGLMLGDAIDDILDITNELSEVMWLVDQKRLIEACWDFSFGYDHHWRYHLRSLLWYLEMRRFEAP